MNWRNEEQFDKPTNATKGNASGVSVHEVSDGGACVGAFGGACGGTLGAAAGGSSGGDAGGDNSGTPTWVDRGSPSGGYGSDASVDRYSPFSPGSPDSTASGISSATAF